MLQVSLALSDRALVLLATGTAVHLVALPGPPAPRLLDTTGLGRPGLVRQQTSLAQRVQANKECLNIFFTDFTDQLSFKKLKNFIPTFFGCDN